MAFDFDKLKNNILSAGKDVSDKVSEASSIAKLKIDIHNKEDFVEKQYAELGRTYYLAHKDEEDTEYAEFFKSIGEANDEIESLKAQILSLQGAVICPSCGLKQQKDHTFCSGCGAELPKVEETTEEKAEDDAEYVDAEIVDSPEINEEPEATEEPEKVEATESVEEAEVEEASNDDEANE